MITIVIRDVEIEDSPPVVFVGMSEGGEEGGADFIFMADLRHNDFREGSNWPEGESYCVTNSGGLTSYGGVLEAELDSGLLRVKFSDRTAEVLVLAGSEVSFRVDAEGVDFAHLATSLRRILTCGRPEYFPRLVGFADGP
ncbi:hypothetical protein OG444_30290 [Streptomyces sp. NBC_01232]|uniref:hypothetical protein n=1 Tax=Streptomyces sp. NBC_01232 TaxID=2903786 RepID=UPI002E15DEDB|nr:hypothetical protein OG444_30290 [Streptomyces sp. NBC_01232]